MTETWNCQLCGDPPDAPLLKDEIWNRLGGRKLLCFECAEHLLKRQLRLNDLKECAANHATFVMVRRAMEEPKPKTAAPKPAVVKKVV